MKNTKKKTRCFSSKSVFRQKRYFSSKTAFFVKIGDFYQKRCFSSKNMSFVKKCFLLLLSKRVIFVKKGDFRQKKCFSSNQCRTLAVSYVKKGVFRQKSVFVKIVGIVILSNLFQRDNFFETRFSWKIFSPTQIMNKFRKKSISRCTRLLRHFNNGFMAY